MLSVVTPNKASANVLMRQVVSIILLCGLFLLPRGAGRLVMGQVPAAGRHPRSVTVELADGRAFTAEVDPQTDATHLWLRWSRGSATLLRPIRWEEVERLDLGDELVSSSAFREATIKLRQAAGQSRPSIGQPITIVVKGPDNRSAADPSTDSGRQRAGDVRSLAIDVRTANWDGNVEVDGLVVDVYPLDATGRPVLVNGTLDVRLIVQHTGVVKRKQPFSTEGRWTRTVRHENFGPNGASYRLPFGRFHPQFDRRSSAYGAVHARLSVPGKGVFEATETTVRIRPYGLLRDELQQATGRRFFHVERTGRL